MPNRLTKTGSVTYIPAVPPKPAGEAYCVVQYGYREKKQAKPSAGGRASDGSSGGWGAVASKKPGVYVDARGTLYEVKHDGSVYVATRGLEVGMQIVGTQWVRVVDGSKKGGGAAAPVYERYIVGQQCFPATEGQDGVPAYDIVNNYPGWNAGARSIASFLCDGYVQFTTCQLPVGIVAGLSNADVTTAFQEASHAIYAHGTTIDIIESGQVVATAPYSPQDQPRITIARRRGNVIYFVDDWYFVSEKQSSGAVLLDAALYLAGDYIDSPILSADPMPVDFVEHGSGSVTLPAWQAMGEGDAPQAVGNVVWGAFTADNAAPVCWPPGPAHGVARLLPIVGVGGRATTYGTSAFPAFRAEGYVGAPQFSVAYGFGIVSPIQAWGLSLVGAKGDADVTLQGLRGLGADKPYAGGECEVFRDWRAYGYDQPVKGRYETYEFVWAIDFAVVDPTLWAEIYDGIELSSTASIMLSIDNAYVDALLLQPTLSVASLLNAMIVDQLVLTSTAPAAANAALQYAVNVATGALSVYQGFDFSGFARADDQAYGWRADGVYRLIGDTDDGALRNALVDFGTDGLDTNHKKFIPGVFLGLGTDGCAYLRMTADDGCEQVYRVIQRDDVCRANPHRGISAREWRVKLELVDATSAMLDNIEYVIEVASRRWTR